MGMRAHRTRKAVWLSNIPLSLALLGIAAWYLADVGPAVSAVVDAPRQDPGAVVNDVVRDFDRDVRNTSAASLLPPVVGDELEETYWPRHFLEMVPVHWPLSGSPPSNQRREAPPPDRPRSFELTAYGVAAMVFHDPPLGGTVTFHFRGGKKTAVILVGESLTLADGVRAELVSIREIEEDLYDTLWRGIQRDGTSTLDTVSVDGRKVLLPTDPVRPSDPGAIAVPADATPERTSVHRIGHRRVPVAGGRTRIEFNDGAAEWVRSGAARKALESIKTAIAKDAEGRVLGIRIVDFGEAPLDRLALERGDTVVSIDGQPVASRADVVRIAQALSPETESVEVVVDRYGRRITFDVDPRDAKTRRRMAQHLEREGR